MKAKILKNENGSTLKIKNFAINFEEGLYDTIDPAVIEVFEEAYLMPDTHIGADVPIGFVAQITDKIIPNVVGVDIGCGLTSLIFTTEEELTIEDFEILDQAIKDNIPNGFNVNQEPQANLDRFIAKLSFKPFKIERIELALGTLGGGNHFIELGRNFENEDQFEYMITVHSGSRNLGKQVNEWHQNKLDFDKEAFENAKNDVIKNTKDKTQLSGLLKNIKREDYTKSYLTGLEFDLYLNDMKLAQDYALENRKIMIQKALMILKFLASVERVQLIDCTHNYIDKDMIVRKGAISAKAGEDLIIPINMRDGVIIGTGKGNQEWYNSAPHGAGRVLGRKAAKRELNVENFKDQMNGIYSSTINENTLDEAPDAYRSIEEIQEAIKDSVNIKKIFKPVYNFKGEQ